jgi:predicted ribosome quality control (RQC) complex YloA/Tae2 family protein
MDNLVLTRLAFDLAAELPGRIIDGFRQESSDRFRISFAGDRVTSLVVSIHPERPWIGRPALRWEGPRWSPDPVAVACARRLVGLRVEAVVKKPDERSLLLRCAGGSGLLVDLRPHASNLLLIGDRDEVEAGARPPRARQVPLGRIDPFAHDAEEIDAFLADADDPRRALSGVGVEAFEVASLEARAKSITVGTALKARLDAVVRGMTEVVILGPEEPRAALARHELGPPVFRILPWRPSEEGGVFAEGSSAATAGLYYEGADASARLRARLHALRVMLRSEVGRTARAARRVEADLATFEDPDRHQRLGEALLAGITTARRENDVVWVPDPYGAAGEEVAVPAARGTPLADAAGALFKKARRSRRGRTAATERGAVLSRRRGRLEEILEGAERAAGVAAADALEAAMREAGIAVGLVRATRAGRAADWLEAPRVSGVRTVTSSSGWTILIGRSGKDNDRLTFKLAAPDDIWLHAAGVTGAHVVIRNPDRTEVPDATLREAAVAAAWFSDARSAGIVDVHWTRRKHVRRARGGAPGRVTLKQFQTLRVRARPPDGLE